VDQSGAKDQGGLLANIPMAGALQRPLAALGAALFGSHGFLTVSPVLLVGVAGLGAAALGAGRAPGEPRPDDAGQTASIPRHAIVAVAVGCAVLALGHATLVASLGGWSYGYRYLIPLVPFLLFFVPTVVPERGHWLLGCLVALSIGLALLGAYNPWPPVWEPETQGQGLDTITNPVGVNLAAWLSAWAPDLGLTERVAARFISPDERVRNRYLYFFHRSKGDDEEAVAAYLRSLSRDPDRAATHYDYAEVLAALDRPEAATHHYARAIELAPDFAEARRGLAASRATLAAGRQAVDAAKGAEPGTP
jgi:hypothetical protein